MSYKTLSTKKGDIILIDESDFDELNKYSWSIGSHGYPSAYVAGTGRKNRKSVLMHRLLMGFPVGLRVDHRNRNKLDNQKENLRVCTNSQNLGNSIGYSKNTKYKGINKLPSGKWRARINIGRKSIHLGVADSEDQAAQLYDKAAAKHYGSFALTNLMIGETR